MVEVVEVKENIIEDNKENEIDILDLVINNYESITIKDNNGDIITIDITPENTQSENKFFTYYFNSPKCSMVKTINSNINNCVIELIDCGYKVINYYMSNQSICCSTWLNKQNKNLIKLVNYESYVVAYYIFNNESYNKIKDLFSTIKLNPVVKNKIYLVTYDGRDFQLKTNEIKDFSEIDLDLNYNDGFIEFNNKLIDDLSQKNSSGLTLLHGIPGSGKSTYIRYLLTKLDKKVIYIPSYLVDQLSSPTFLPFVIDKCKNSVLIIEEAENLLCARDSGNKSSAIQNILNISSGILGDILNIQIIATFNTGKENLDPALLRKGRLLAEWCFDKLSIEKTNNLLKHLNKDEISVNSMVLSDIYNIEKFETKLGKKAKIGFSK